MAIQFANRLSETCLRSRNETDWLKKNSGNANLQLISGHRFQKIPTIQTTSVQIAPHVAVTFFSVIKFVKSTIVQP